MELGWETLETNSGYWCPGHADVAAMAYDSDRSRSVLFGETARIVSLAIPGSCMSIPDLQRGRAGSRIRPSTPRILCNELTYPSDVLKHDSLCPSA